MSGVCRVAVVGLGYFSQYHLESWIAHPDVELVGATDLNAKRRAWAKDSYDAPVFEDLNHLLATDPQVVDIVAPPPAHADILRACFAPGRVLVCQKPFCASIEEAEQVLREADAANTRILIHENFRFQPWHRSLKAFLDSGRLGQVYSAQFFLRPGDGRGEDAYLDRQPAFQTMPRLLIHETGVHFIDLFRWLFGNVASVYADLRRLNPVLAGEDAGLLIMEHSNGARSVFDGNRLADHVTDAPRRTMGEMRIEGEGGTLLLNGNGDLTFRPFGTHHSEAIPLDYVPDDSFGGGCVNALNSHVIDALNGRCSFENEGWDYLPVIRLCERAYESHQTGQKLNMEDV